MQPNPEIPVAFISNGLTVGGAERFSLNLINALVKRGIKPLVILLSDHNPLLYELSTSVEYIVLSRRFRYDLSVSWKIRRILRERGIRKVFCVESFPLMMGKFALFFDPSVTFYVSLHNSLPISKGQQLRDYVYLSLFRKTDIALFICNYQKDCFRKYYGFSPSRYEVIYNGTDTQRYHWPDERYPAGEFPAWKKAIGLGEKDKTILMIGRISIEKAHTEAVKALAHLHRQLDTRAHLVIVGGGDEALLQQVKALVDKEQLGDYVHFMGSHSDVRPFLQYTDLFTLTSFSETFSLAALEATASGLPVSLTHVGGAAEMVVHPWIGELSEKNNPASIAGSWKTILEGRYDRAKISRFTQEQFSLETMIGHYETILRR